MILTMFYHFQQINNKIKTKGDVFEDIAESKLPHYKNKSF